jgi:putative phosphoribosyl transferase
MTPIITGYTRCMTEESGAGPDPQTGYSLPFPDRQTAGRLLADRLAATAALSSWAGRTVVLGLPRGGVAVARQVATVLDAPMDVIVTRKIGYPPQPELGVGAMAEDLGATARGAVAAGPPVFDIGLLARLGLSPEDLTGVMAAEEAELARRVRVYRGNRPPPQVAGRGVIVVDDGLATGVTARAALRSLRAAQAGYLVLAVPVASPSAAAAMREEADQVIVLAAPRRFASVGEWYRSFGQLTDADVLALLT